MKQNAGPLPRVTIPVSKRNYNRVKFGTMKIDKMLKREGFCLVGNGCITIDGREIRINSIDLRPIKKIDPPVPSSADTDSDEKPDETPAEEPSSP